MRKSVSQRRHILTVLLVAILCVSITSYVFSSNSEIPIEKHSFIKTANCVIENDEGIFKAFDGQTGELRINSSDIVTVWNYTRGNILTSARTWKEKVVFKGEFEIDYNGVGKQVIVPNYTILDFAGSLIKVKDGTGCDDDYGIFRGESDPCTDIDIIGLSFDENAGGAPDGWAYILWFTNASNMIIRDCDFRSPDLGYGLWIDGVEDVGEQITFHNSYFANTNPEVYSSDTVFEFCFFSFDNVKIRGENSIVTLSHLADRSEMEIRGDFSKITNNYFEGAEDPFLSICSVRADNVIVSDNIFNGKYFVTRAINSGAVGKGNYMRISDNTFMNLKYGIDLVYGDNIEIHGNNFVNNYEYAVKVSEGNATIENNKFLNNTKAIYLESVNSVNHFISNNYFENNTVTIDNEGTGTVIRHNKGYITENSGTATDKANGGTIAHGLVGKPTSVDLTCLNVTYDNELVLVYWDEPNTDTTNISLDIYWVNGTAITDGVIDISWDARYYP